MGGLHMDGWSPCGWVVTTWMGGHHADGGPLRPRLRSRPEISPESSCVQTTDVLGTGLQPESSCVQTTDVLGTGLQPESSCVQTTDVPRTGLQPESSYVQTTDVFGTGLQPRFP